MKTVAADDNPPTTAVTPRPPASGRQVLAFIALAVIVALGVGGVVLYNASTDPGFRTSAMEKRVRAGIPPGWKVKIDDAEEHTGPCIDGCEGSSLDVTLTAADPHASRATQQRELATAMRAGGWAYHPPLTRAQALALYLSEYPTDLGDPPVDADDQTIMFDPHDAGLFDGGPSDARSNVGYEITAQWFDGHLSLSLSASQGD